MATSLQLLLGAATCVSAMAVTRGAGIDAAKPAPVTIPVYQDVRTHPVGKLRKRRDAASDDDDNNNAPIYNVTSTSYLIELNIGSPGQTVKVALDTGSSELWLNPNCANAGSNAQQQVCDDHGQYSPSKSGTSQASETRNTISYGKGQVVLQYISDTIQMPGTDIDLDKVIFGYALDSVDLSTGILGLGFGKGVNTQYATFTDELYEQNRTESRTFGVALGTKNEKTGSGVISFGGVDTKKFSGELYTMPILPRQNNEKLSRYWVQLESVGLTHDDGETTSVDNSSFPVFFDTGATLSYLPANVVKTLAEDLGGQYDSSVGLYAVPCGQQGSVDFTFGGNTVHVPLTEFIWEAGRDVCVLGADVEDDGSFILGDSFLRSVYTVFDQETPALHFAQYVNCGSNMHMIPAGANATRQFKGECTQSSINCSHTQCDGGESSSGTGGGSNGGTPDGEGNGAGSLAAPGGAWLAVAGVLGAAMAAL